MGAVADYLDLARQAKLLDPLGRDKHPALSIGFDRVQTFVDPPCPPAVFFVLEDVQRFDVLGIELVPRVGVIDAHARFIVLESHEYGTVLKVISVSRGQGYAPLRIEGVVELTCKQYPLHGTTLDQNVPKRNTFIPLCPTNSSSAAGNAVLPRKRPFLDTGARLQTGRQLRNVRCVNMGCNKFCIHSC